MYYGFYFYGYKQWKELKRNLVIFIDKVRKVELIKLAAGGRFGLFLDSDPSLLFELKPSNTRGHKLKLFKKRCKSNVRKTFFTPRVINDWNNLLIKRSHQLFDSGIIRTSI